MSTMLTTYFNLYLVIHFVWSQDVPTSISILTASDSGAGTTNTAVTLTLLFNNVIYKCDLNPTDENTIYSCDDTQYQTIGPHCSSDFKILIENSVTNSVYINEISVTTATETYGISMYCVDAALTGTSAQAQFPVVNSNECTAPLTQYNNIGLSLSASYSPAKQLVHFDETRPNTYIRNAQWEDGTGVTIEPTQTCVPTSGPTKYPSKVPTKYPSEVPTKYPSEVPTKYPTKYPTYVPTSVTVNPTSSPTGDECDCDGKNDSNGSDDDSDNSSDDISAAALLDQNIQLHPLDNGNNDGTTVSVISLYFSNETLMNIWILFGVLMIVNIILCFIYNRKKG
eukprot:789392_1